MKAIAFLLALLLPSVAMSASWSAISGPLKGLRGGNYCDISQNKCHDSNNGSTATGDFWINGVKAMSRSTMASYGFRGNQGRILSYARTIAVDRDWALLHLGDGYPSNTGFMPVFAEREGSQWHLRGPIKVDGAVRYIQSSSMAYLNRGGTHYMVQDAGAYGKGRLVAFVSNDGINYRKIGGDIAAVTGDSGPAFPDLAYFGGRYHLVFVGPSWSSCAVRHLSAASMAGPWRLESRQAMCASKSVNLCQYGGKLYAYSMGRHWVMGGGAVADTPSQTVASAGACSNLAATVSGRTIKATFSRGRCTVRAIGPKRYFRGGTTRATFKAVKPGSYKLQIRERSSNRYGPAVTVTVR